MNTHSATINDRAAHSNITRRNLFLTLATVATLTCLGTAAADELLTPIGPASPGIVVHSPETSTPIKGPVRIDVAFVPAGNVPIDPASLKVSYGTFGIDITERVRRYATVSAQGITAELPSMPKGQHTFKIQISDLAKRSAQVRLRCEVIG